MYDTWNTKEELLAYIKRLEKENQRLEMFIDFRDIEVKKAKDYLSSIGIDVNKKGFGEGDVGKTVYVFYGLKWHKAAIVVAYWKFQLHCDEKIHDESLGGGHDITMLYNSPYFLSEEQYKVLLQNQ